MRSGSQSAPRKGALPGRDRAKPLFAAHAPPAGAAWPETSSEQLGAKADNAPLQTLGSSGRGHARSAKNTPYLL